jgi:hemolysin activation/secretion protein
MSYALNTKIFLRLWVLALLGICTATRAQTTPQNPLDQQTQQNRAKQSQQQIEQSQQADRVTVPTGNPSQTSWRDMTLPAEPHCFLLKDLTLEGAHENKFGFAQRYLNRYRGRCVGQAGLKQILERTADRIITAGYVTTQVKLKTQNISTGRLEVVLIPGIFEGFKFSKGSPPINWRSAFSIRPGSVLNIRELEQGLEQIKAVSSQDVHMNIEPGSQPSTSYVVLEIMTTTPWRVYLSANNDGFDSTGRNQGTVNLQRDELLHLNDTLSLTYEHSLEINHGHFGSANTSGDERMTWGMWTLDLSISNYHFYQQLLGGTETFRSTGDSQNYGIHLSRVIHRSATERTTASLNLDARQAYNYIDDVPITVQTRHTRAITAALAERKYLGKGQLDVNVSYQHGVPWFKGQWDPSTPDALIPRFDYQRWQSDIGLQLPFRIHSHSLSLSNTVHAQYSPDRLYGEDYVAVGGPYSVRGFDNNLSLAADDGYYLRNQLNWQIAHVPRFVGKVFNKLSSESTLQPSLYLGLDEGGVYGPDFSYPGGHVLAGYCIGTSGAFSKHMQWDVSASRQMWQPDWVGDNGRTIVKGSFNFLL